MPQMSSVRSSAWTTPGVCSDTSHCIGYDIKQYMSEDLIGFVCVSVVATARNSRFGSCSYSRAASVRKSYALLAPIIRGSQTTCATVRRQRMETSFVAYRRVRLYMFTCKTFICGVRVQFHMNRTTLHRRVHSSLRCS